MTGAPLDSALRLLSRRLTGRMAEVDGAFRAWLSKRRFNAAQAAALSAITPGAALQSFAAGVPSAEIVAEAGRNCHRLALMDLDARAIARVLRKYGELAAPVCSDAAVASAAMYVECAVLVRASEAVDAVHSAESAFLRSLLDIETTAAGAVSELLQPFAERVADHFKSQAVLVCNAVGRGVLRVAAAAPADLANVVKLRRALVRKLATERTCDAVRANLAVVGDDGHRSIWSMPIETAEQRVCVVQVAFSGQRAWLPREQRLLADAAAWCRVAMARIEREERLRGLILRTLEVETLERGRMSRELHDDAAQMLVCARLQLELAEGAEDAREAARMMAESREHLEKAIIVVRRLISDMSPAVLEKLGLDAAIRQIVNRFIKSYDGRVTFHVAKLPVVDTPFAMVVFRALQECFTNIARHSLATDINVSLTLVDRVLRLRVEDNGVGFHVEEGLGRQNCYGLIGIRERVTLLGGRFRIRSTRESGDTKEDNPASGTRIDIELPIPEGKP